MKPRNFNKATHTLGAPENWNEVREGRCFDLPVALKDGACVSCWTFTEEERKAVAEGKDLYVHVLSGETQPPIMLVVED